MSFTATQRPGVFTECDIVSLRASNLNASAIGLSVYSEKPVNGIQTITRESQAISLFGDTDNVTKLVRIMLSNGCSTIYVDSLAKSEGGTAPSEDAYEASLKRLAAYPDISILTCDAVSDTLAVEFGDLLTSAAKNRHEMIGVMAVEFEDLTAAASALNNERMILHGQGDGTVSAALAAKLSSLTDPTQSISGEVLSDVALTGAPLTESEISTVIAAGGTALETVYGQTQVIRCVTTRTTSNGTADLSFRDISTILTVDYVMKSIRNALTLRLKGLKNNARTLGAIATQTQVELQAQVDAEHINSYEEPYVTLDPNDPTICLVEVTFTITSGINQIRITAHISL